MYNKHIIDIPEADIYISNPIAATTNILMLTDKSLPFWIKQNAPKEASMRHTPTSPRERLVFPSGLCTKMAHPLFFQSSPTYNLLD